MTTEYIVANARAVRIEDEIARRGMQLKRAGSLDGCGFQDAVETLTGENRSEGGYTPLRAMAARIRAYLRSLGRRPARLSEPPGRWQSGTRRSTRMGRWSKPTSHTAA